MGTFTDLVHDVVTDHVLAANRAKAAEEMKAARAAREKEAAEAKAREAELAAKAQQNEAALAAAQKALRVAENRARTQRIDALAAQRAQRKGRAVTGEDRSWAARQIAKVEGP
jgi:hypothetical protein